MGWVANFMNRIMSATGLGPTMEEKLDMAAEQSQKTVTLKRELAGSAVALARTKRRELDDAVGQYENLRAAAIQLQQQGRTDVVNLMAVKMTTLDELIGRLTTEVESLNAGATQAVADYQNEASEVQQLLSNHGQVRAAARMNSEMLKLQKDMKALGGLSTARASYQALTNEIEVKTQTFRAMAELENNGATQDAQVRRALRDVETQQTLRMIQEQAGTQGALPASSSSLDRARQALSLDPVYGQIPTRVFSDPLSSAQVIEGSVVETTEE